MMAMSEVLTTAGRKAKLAKESGVVSSQLRQHLRSLNLRRVAPKTKTVQSRCVDLEKVQECLGGELHGEGEIDRCLVMRRTFSLSHNHGCCQLGDILLARSDTLALLAGDKRLSAMSPGQALFVDAETTGLGGAGALVFLWGMGRFCGDSFEVVQVFLPGPASEAAFLHAVEAAIPQDSFLVSYNGRRFDVPVLESRFVLQRRRLPLSRWPHLDLLYASRKLYRARVADCRLATIEGEVLDLERSSEDVPGALVPAIYFNYLRLGKIEPLSAVLYHNLVDILSLATLSAVVASTIEGRANCHPLDLLGAARLLEKEGRLDEAVGAYRQAVSSVDGTYRREAMLRLGFALKRSRRYEEAAEVWCVLVESGIDRSAVAHVELAKHLEHRRGDYAAAAEVTDAALRLPSARSSPVLRASLEHRLGRLKRRLARAAQ